MLKLNDLYVMAYENAKKREAKDGKVSTNTRLMLKHTATEVVEAAESYSLFKPMKDITSDGTNYELGFRMLQPNELAASTGFPSDYKFKGTKVEVVKQIGNAVPPNFAKALFGQILSELLDKEN